MEKPTHDSETFDDEIVTGIAVILAFATLRLYIPDLGPFTAGAISSIAAGIIASRTRIEHATFGVTFRNILTAASMLVFYDRLGKSLFLNPNELHELTLILATGVTGIATIWQGVDKLSRHIKH